ncbi:phage holin, partial [Enterobacter hormaechei]|uniref:phage holin n=1 Tax=Enterobacter hormaechei TaxID=158836 RepID=UPI003CC66591
FNPQQWVFIGIFGGLVIKVAEWLTDRYFARRHQKRQSAKPDKPTTKENDPQQ